MLWEKHSKDINKSLGNYYKMASKSIYNGHVTGLLGERIVYGQTLGEFLKGTDAELINNHHQGYRYDSEESSYPKGDSSYLLRGAIVTFSYWENPLGAQFISVKLVGDEKKLGEVEKIVLESIEQWKSRAPHPVCE